MSKYTHDLGDNVERLIEVVKSLGKEKIFVDLGVRFGVSSQALLTESDINKNKIYGVDILFSPVNSDLKNHPNYNFIVGESVTEGSKWENEKVDLVFIDTTHIKEYTMCELFYWWDLINVGGYVVFHDSAQDYKHTDTIPGLVSSGTNGPLEPVYKAICEFFMVDNLTNSKSENVEITHYPTSHGMTFIKKIKEFDFKKKINNWDYYFNSRQVILNFLTSNYNFKLPENTIININIHEKI